MAKNNNLTDFLRDTADAIRAAKGTTGAINPQNFASEIASIGTKTLTTGDTMPSYVVIIGLKDGWNLTSNTVLKLTGGVWGTSEVYLEWDAAGDEYIWQPYPSVTTEGLGYIGSANIGYNARLYGDTFGGMTITYHNPEYIKIIPIYDAT